MNEAWAGLPGFFRFIVKPGFFENRKRFALLEKCNTTYKNRQVLLKNASIEWEIFPTLI